MKKLNTLALVALLISFVGCQDSKEDSKAIENVSAYKNVGKQISLETGLRWIATYNKENNIQGRVDGAPYEVSKDVLNQALASVSDLIGVSFHHGIDSSGVHHFIVIPVDNTLSLWSNSATRVYVDANTNTVISRTVAREWAERYESANPNAIWFHFFGSNVFDQIAEISFFENLNIEPALSDLDLSPQLLLIIAEEGLVTDLLPEGRYQSETIVYDASSPCPPCPVR